MKQSYILLKDKLKDAYKEAFNQVELYGIMNLIGEDEQEERLMELIDNMMLAQEAGDDVTKIVGTDMEAFCREFYSDYGMENRLMNIPKLLRNAAWGLFILTVLELIFPDEKASFDLMASSDTAPFIVGISGGFLINAIIYMIIRPFFAKHKKTKSANIMLWIVLAGVMILACGIALSGWFEVMIPRLYLIIATTLYLILFYFIVAVQNWKRYGSVRKPKVERVSFREAFNISLETELPAEWLKQYNKKRKRAIKKGKTPISCDEFMEKLAKRYHYGKEKWVNIGIFGGITLCSIAAMVIADAYETPIDLLLFAVFLIAIEALICCFSVKNQKRTNQIFKQMKERMDEKNITLEEYVQTLKEMEDKNM